MVNSYEFENKALQAAFNIGKAYEREACEKIALDEAELTIMHSCKAPSEACVQIARLIRHRDSIPKQVKGKK